MKIETHVIQDVEMAEVVASETVINSIEDGTDLLGNLYYQGFDKIILHAQNITPDFFDLKNGMAGELLQKFANFRVRLVIIGDFSVYTRKSVQDFIFESNQGKQVNFVASQAEALKVLTR